nr:MAG TPA: hypothetical protein [Caudoviricetes sp.]
MVTRLLDTTKALSRKNIGCNLSESSIKINLSEVVFDLLFLVTNQILNLFLIIVREPAIFIKPYFEVYHCYFSGI